jgi:hypothetical protein
LPPAELNHLRHERERVELASIVEGGQNFGGAPNFDKLARAQIQALI